MVTVVNNTAISALLKKFSDRLWDCINDKGDDQRMIYDEKVADLIRLMVPLKIKSKKTTMKELNPGKIPIPFCGIVEKSWCCGIKKNHWLYTQCSKPRPIGGIYCKTCLNQSKKQANGKPNCGDIRDREESWDGEELSYKPSGMTQEVPYANVVSKLNLDLSIVRDIVNNLGWGKIPDIHLIEKKRKRGRPKTKIVVEDSDDESPKRGRGRPKKVVRELTDDEIIAQFMESIE